MITRQIIENGIFGLAIGDALGVPYEYKHRNMIKNTPCRDMIGYGTYGKAEGTWSDDTGLTLAMLDGLSEIKNGRYSPIMDKFVLYLKYGNFTVDGVFDIGNTCESAIRNYFLKGEDPLSCGLSSEQSNGNGSLMRILPAVFYSLQKFGTINRSFIDDMSALTHAHSLSKVSCNIYANVVWGILLGENLCKTISKATKKSISKKYKEFNRLRSKKFKCLKEEEISSSSYVVDTLESALWCLCNTRSFSECVLKAVNLGDDTDTVGAVAGSLAGIYYGKESIPKTWIKTLRGQDVINASIDKFYTSLIK